MNVWLAHQYYNSIMKISLIILMQAIVHAQIKHDWMQ